MKAGGWAGGGGWGRGGSVNCLCVCGWPLHGFGIQVCIGYYILLNYTFSLFAHVAIFSQWPS